MNLTKAERSALLAILHGAADDDDGDDEEYTAALTSLSARARTAVPHSELPEAGELVSSKEIADMLGVKHTTVHRYRQRGTLPEPYVVLACGPIWLRSTIDHWARFERRTRG